MPAYVDEVVIVDGRSVDFTVEIARALRADVAVVAEPRAGKGTAARAGLRIAEVPSLELSRISGNSNLQTFRDGWRVLRTLGRECIAWDAPTAGARPEALRRVKHTYPSVRSPAHPPIRKAFLQCHMR
ncbi:glycosyltransferase [Arthrobacter sp. MDT2-2]